MNSLTQTDMNYLEMRIPRDIIAMMKRNPENLFVAGGFIRSIIAGEPVSDIDLFSTTPVQAEIFAEELAAMRGGKTHYSRNAVTVLAPPRKPVQFITRWVFENPQQLIDSFDFTVCQAVLWYRLETLTDEEGTSKVNLNTELHSLCSNGFYPDLAAKRLVYTFPVREEEAGGSFMRMLKFIRRGYNIQAPNMAGVMARIVKKIDFKKHDNPTEEWISTIIISLLREVDPLRVNDSVEIIEEELL